MTTVNDMVAELNFRAMKTVAFDAKLDEIATDPPVSEAQRKAMFAAKSGHSTLGIPKSVGTEFANADPGGKLPSKAKDGGPGSGPQQGSGHNTAHQDNVRHLKMRIDQLKGARSAQKQQWLKDAQEELKKLEGAKDSGRWGGRARDAMNMDAWTNSILDKFEKEKEDAPEMAPKKVEGTVKAPERVAKDNESFNPNVLKAETSAQRRHDEANLVKDGGVEMSNGRWGGRMSPHAKDGGPGSGPKGGGFHGGFHDPIGKEKPKQEEHSLPSKRPKDPNRIRSGGFHDPSNQP